MPQRRALRRQGHGREIVHLFTVNGRVPLGDDGAALYSQRRPYVRVKVRVAFHVSCAKMLTLVKASCTSSFLEMTKAWGIVFARALDNDREDGLLNIGIEPGLRGDPAIIRRRISSGVRRHPGEVVRHVDLSLPVVSQFRRR